MSTHSYSPAPEGIEHDPAPESLESEYAGSMGLGADMSLRAVLDVLAERTRQKNSEGWTPEHDDQYAEGELARAGAWYAIHSVSYRIEDLRGPADLQSVSHALFSNDQVGWPFHAAWFKPKSQRQDLVRATALLLAEIERIDRAAAREEG